MFPFHRLPDPQTALVITKSKGVTPLLEDLRDSPFAQEAQKKFSTANQPIRVWHIGDDLTPYLRSLREFRLLLVFTGDWDRLGQLISAGQFYENPENEQTVVIPNSGLRITRQDTVVAGLAKGSDHLLRLFAYNDIMRKTGSNYFSARFEPAPLVREAEEAFIVTPVSSLVVLEKQEDYKRFGIDENKNTLGNAAMSGKGSVPEPGEWALLLLLTLSVWWVWRQKIIR
jgi:XrtN system VIT domain protein